MQLNIMEVKSNKNNVNAYNLSSFLTNKLDICVPYETKQGKM